MRNRTHSHSVSGGVDRWSDRTHRILGESTKKWENY